MQKIRLLLLAFFMMVFTLTICQTTEAQYTLTDNDVVVIDGYIDTCIYDFAITDIIIPETLDGQLILGIADREWGNGVFEKKDITSVKFPSTMEVIGTYSFWSCSLISLDLSDCSNLVTIGKGAFGGNDITNLDLSNCSSLDHIGHLSFIGNDLTNLSFNGCTALTYIGDEAFDQAGISSVNFDDCSSLKFIGYQAFYMNDISSVNLSACTDLVYIGIVAFASNSMSGFALPVNAEYNHHRWIDDSGSLHDGGKIVYDFYTYYTIPVPYTLTDEDVVVNNGLIQSCSYDFTFKNITIPEILDGQTIIGIADKGESESGVFEGKVIIEIELPATIQYIGDFAFRTNALRSLNLSACSGLTHIGDYAFRSNVIPELNVSNCPKLTVIGKQAFAFTGMNNLDLSNCTNLTTIGQDAFAMNDLINLDLSPCIALTNIGDGAFSQNELTTVSLSNCVNLTRIGDGAFSGNNLDSVNLNPCTSLTYIGDKAFISNEIDSVNLVNCHALLHIGSEAFKWNNLNSMILPMNAQYETLGWLDNAQTIHSGGDIVTNFNSYYAVPAPYTLTDDDVVVTDGIIQSCSYDFTMKNIIIPDTLDGQTVIGIAGMRYPNGVFIYKGIITLELPSTIETIGSTAFRENELTNLDLSNCNSLVQIGSQAFSFNNIKDLNLEGNSSLASIGTMAFSNNSLSSLDLSYCTALTTIGNSAFGANSILNIDLTKCSILRTIDDGAFSGNSLSEINLNSCSTLTYLGKSAFKGNQLSNIYLDSCSALSFIGEDAFDNNPVSMINLPKNTEFNSYGWIDEDSNSFSSGDLVSTSTTFYTIPAPYTLTDEDVVVIDGFIESTSYNFALKYITIPDTLDGQAVIGIVDKVYQFEGVFYDKYIMSLKLPSTLEYIGDNSFYAYHMYNLDLSECNNLYYVGKQAFEFHSVELLDFSSCPNLTYIGEEAFKTIDGVFVVDFSSSTNLEYIGTKAFIYASLDTLDISNCHSLTYIGENAFNYGNITSLNLPTPEIPGYAFNYWEDKYDSTFTGGQTVYDLESWYTTKLTWTGFQINFTVHDGTNPIESAFIELSGYGSVATNAAGLASFSAVSPENDISYTVTADGYDESMGTISIVDSDVDESVILTLSTYNVNFTVSDGLDPIENAMITLSGYGTATTDGTGLVTFSYVLPEDNIIYTVIAVGYDDATSTISVVDTHVSEEITLVLSTYTIDFTVTVGNIPLESATVSLDGYGTVITDAAGLASFGNVIPATDLAYTVTSPGFLDATSTVSVENSDVSVNVALTITGIPKSPLAEIRLYPNPASEIIYMKTDEDVLVRIMDISGITIIEKLVNKGEAAIPVGHLAAGNYIVKIVGKTSVIIRKMMIE